MTNRQRMLRKVRWTLTAALAGGSLFGACEVRFRDAIVSGSKDYLRTLLDPASILQLLSPEGNNASDGP
jgi:hypothetical protein